jgi:hypothetical protein
MNQDWAVGEYEQSEGLYKVIGPLRLELPTLWAPFPSIFPVLCPRLVWGFCVTVYSRIAEAEPPRVIRFFFSFLNLSLIRPGDAHSPWV